MIYTLHCSINKQELEALRDPGLAHAVIRARLLAVGIPLTPSEERLVVSNGSLTYVVNPANGNFEYEWVGERQPK